MDVVLLSRLQFAAAVFFHFVFVPLTLGLTIFLAYLETRFYKSGDEEYKRMAKFWGKLFLINFALGIVTGITLVFQFGTNWANYSKYVGDVFGPLLAIEATVAFFLESTFIAVWHFGRDRVSKKIHLLSIWLVAAGAHISSLWIILANGWMQNPVGYVLRNGRAELESFWAVVGNPFAWGQLIHTLLAAWLLGAFFIMGVSAWHLMRKHEEKFFAYSFRCGTLAAIALSLLLLAQGHHHGMMVARMQPSKLAAMESHWETTSHAPMYLLVIPDESKERNLVEAFAVPGMLSILAHGDSSAEVTGLKAFPKEDRPPVLITFLSFRAMVGLGSLFPLLAILAWFWREKLAARRWFGWALILAIPLPLVAIMAGWSVAEVGRQPWIVWQLMRTHEGVSAIPGYSVGLSLLAFTGIYSLLGALDVWLLARYARRGPAPLPPQQPNA